jgi:hypothetical protein
MTPIDRISWLRRFVHRRNPSGAEVDAALGHLDVLEAILNDGDDGDDGDKEHTVEVRTTPLGPTLVKDDD